MSKKNNITIKCRSIAPLVNLDYQANLGSIKLGIYASNGSGKTFLSRMFRLIDVHNHLCMNDDGTCPTDYIISLGEQRGEFHFKVTAEGNVPKEDVSLILNKGKVPVIPSTNYIYHTFNQDYVEENIRLLDYQMDSNIQGVILGQVNIDLSDDEKRLSEIAAEGLKLRNDIESKVKSFVSERIEFIPSIHRLKEFQTYFTNDYILQGNGAIKNLNSYDDYLNDYNKIKSIPEGLADVALITTISEQSLIDLSEIAEALSKIFTLSKFSNDYKKILRERENFIREGISLLKNTNNLCPFCKQTLGKSQFELIDDYTKFISDSETQTITLLRKLIKRIEAAINTLKSKEQEILKINNKYNEYKSKYIPSLKDTTLQIWECSPLIALFEEVNKQIELKINSIDKPIFLSGDVKNAIHESIQVLSELICNNNRHINKLNSKKNSASAENLTTRKNLCMAGYNLIYFELKDLIEDRKKLLSKYADLKKDIDKRKESAKVSKKSLVATTIKAVLNHFFNNKYTLNEETFELEFRTTALSKNQVSHFLSEGEKNIIAFAYYLGEVHLKITKESDYERLFFIIDDPISSMDYGYVYTLSGVIRELKVLFEKIKYERFIILTHNNDFMRIISSNNIVSKSLILRNSTLKDFNINFSVPYINHLIDIYKVSTGEPYNHTTPNSIRHIIETLIKFEYIVFNQENMRQFILDNFNKDMKTYTFINDLSHGGWRPDQAPLLDEDYKNLCVAVIDCVKKYFPKQIDYCQDFLKIK